MLALFEEAPDYPSGHMRAHYLSVRVLRYAAFRGPEEPTNAQQSEAVMTGETSGGELGQVLQAVRALGDRVDGLSTQVNQLGTRMDRMDTRMDKVEGWMERLGAEFIRSREELKAEIQKVRTDLTSEMHSGFRQLRAEMQEGFHQVHGRIDRTNDAMNLMGSALNKVTTERFQNLEQRVRVLETRDPQA
jgi:chromosome segregation ATPase